MVKKKGEAYERNGVERFDCGGVHGVGKRNGVDQLALEELICGLWSCERVTIGRE